MPGKIIRWDIDAWEDYLYWQNQDKKMLKKINSLIKETLRDPYTGIGKPEQLKDNLSGFWSRHINDEHRLVYAIEDNGIVIISCKGHYDDR